MAGFITLLIIGHDVSDSHSQGYLHDAALGNFVLWLLVPPYLLTAGCFLKELLLLKEQLLKSDKSINKAVIVFGVGMIPPLGFLGMLSNLF
ncbi:hypothetical protein ACFST9_00915 [Hymenobacter monticola]|uniref:Uncharacterized protein n=1 Tax=Hymenobacter monticola TaxID=1705399 RepID=A0ABY4BA08_9BACT|nr:hypothetical protein [Hymenobacter monticola]UOE33475.1 hypothetical protein MTP16_20415 [Hymenobacter monticola]